MRHHILSGGLMLVATLAATVFSAAQPAPASDRGAAIDALLSRYAAVKHFNGATLVAEGGNVVQKAGFGLAEVSFAVRNTPETRFRLGAISQLFTGVLIVQLVDERRIGLDATLAELLPDYRKDTGARITIRHLLTHSSGLPDPRGAASPCAGADVPSLDRARLVTDRCSGDLESEPGSVARPNGCNYVLLATVVERVTGQPFERALQERVLAPARLSATTDAVANPPAVVPRLAHGYDRDGASFRLAAEGELAAAFGWSSLASTVGDLYRFDQALYGPLVSATSRQALFTPGQGGLGAGWDVRSLPIGPGGAPRTVASQSGQLGAHQARITRVLEDRHLVVLLSNTSGAPLKEMEQGVLDVLYRRPPASPQLSVAEEVAGVLSTKGLDAALARQRALAAGPTAGRAVSDSELIALGRDLLRQGQTTAGVAILRQVTESSPTSAPAWDALGDALAAAGEKNEAVRSYAKSLQLEPGDTHALERLTTLAKP